MDQIQTGKFIRELRKQKGLTQEQLGEVIGVTNKTVSRWENGNYMPDIDVFMQLSELFGVSINELLSGKRLTNEEAIKVIDENIVSASRLGVFSLRERENFFKKKWQKERGIYWRIRIVLIEIRIIAIVLLKHMPTHYLCFAPIVGGIIAVFEYNIMMKYIEHKLYD